MTEQRSALENALDLLVYAPVGLALTAAEEVPKLAAKGRAQVQGQITMARMVGQFAVAQGRKEIEKRLGVGARPQPAAKPPGAARSTETPSNGFPSNGAASASGRSNSENGSYERLSGRTPASRGAGNTAPASDPGHEAAVIDVDFGTTARTETTKPETQKPETQKPESSAGATPTRTGVTQSTPKGQSAAASGSDTKTVTSPPAEGLAIPGYDSLSASQVVQRLAGLSQDELVAVGEYEAANRGRRTILTRVGQLKG